MARALSSALVLVLLAATAVTFAITEGAKLERSPIYGTQVPTPVFSPDGVTVPVARISFRLRSRERVQAWIEDSAGRDVRTLLTPRTFRRGTRVGLVWDGLSDGGLAEPDGVYTPVVRLDLSHRTIALPNPIRLDTRAPVITVKRPQHTILLSPDGDGRRDVYRVRYTVDEPAHGRLTVDGIQVNFTKSQHASGELVWNGKLRGRSVVPGRYVLRASARDRAGNVAKAYPFAVVQVRYVVLARARVDVQPRQRFAIRVSTDAAKVNWRFRGRSGMEPRGTLHFRAPRKRGVYHLYVYVAGHAARCTVVVS